MAAKKKSPEPKEKVMPSATAPEQEVNSKGLVKKSIILTPETWAIAQEIQELFMEMSLSALCRNLIEQFGPGILANKMFPSQMGLEERNKIHLDDEVYEILQRIGKELGIPPSGVATQIIVEAAEKWTRKALEARERMRLASEELAEE